MADPVLRPLKWNKEFHVYAEQNGMFDVLMELFRELVMWKPQDPLVFIRDELPRIGRSIYAPRVFILGEHPAIEIGRNIAESTGSLFLTLEDIVTSAPDDIKTHVLPTLYDHGEPDLCLSSLLVATINRRIAMADCMNCGYVIHGFPRTKTEAMNAQLNGLIPRQVFILLPEGVGSQEKSKKQNGRGLRGAGDGKLSSKLSISQLQDKRDFLSLKDIGAAYSPEVCRVIPYDRWVTTKQSDLEAEFLGQIIARKPAGAPWIPKIVVIGPPGSGKSIIAEHLAEKFNIVKIDWKETIRGFSRMNDAISVECKAYLETLAPLSEDAVKIILDRKLNREDCQKKGFVLEGFPESALQAKIMEDMSLTANRIFIVSCAESEILSRMAEKREAIYSRRLSFPSLPAVTPEEDDNMYLNPHSESAVKKRYDCFNQNMEDIIAFYGSRMVYIDGNQAPGMVREFAEASVIRPPTLRF
jgi:adenylate kinase